MALHLSESTIRARLVEWMNLKKLHRAARERVEALVEEVRRLKDALAREREEKAALAEELQKRTETVEKLQKLLFERHAPRTRMVRPHEPKSRDAASYRRSPPETITERRTLSLTHCPECTGHVSSAQSSRTRIIEDIVLHPQATATEWTITRHFCAHCKRLVEADVPGVLPHALLGPGVLTLVTIARYRWNLPYTKIRDVLSLAYGLTISDGEVAHLLASAVKLVGPKWQEIVEAVKLGKRVHCDETGWYVDGEKVWAHVFSSENVTLYAIHDTRGKGVAEKALGKDFTGTRITDCLANYKHLPGSHQICWEHPTREAHENEDREPQSQERTVVSQEFNAIYARLREETSDWERASAQKAKRWCERKVASLLALSWHDPPSRRLVERLDDFRSALFTCLEYPGIPPDNNEAERCLRKLVVQRKISGGNRSWKHAGIHATIMSVMETLRKEGDDVLAGLQTLIQNGIAVRLSNQ